jgi:hypothetical protein
MRAGVGEAPKLVVIPPALKKERAALEGERVPAATRLEQLMERPRIRLALGRSALGDHEPGTLKNRPKLKFEKRGIQKG